MCVCVFGAGHVSIIARVPALRVPNALSAICPTLVDPCAWINATGKLWSVPRRPGKMWREIFLRKLKEDIGIAWYSKPETCEVRHLSFCFFWLDEGPDLRFFTPKFRQMISYFWKLQLLPGHSSLSLLNFFYFFFTFFYLEWRLAQLLDDFPLSFFPHFWWPIAMKQWYVGYTDERVQSIISS